LIIEKQFSHVNQPLPIGGHTRHLADLLFECTNVLLHYHTVTVVSNSN
jgi:hypothetical protein